MCKREYFESKLIQVYIQREESSCTPKKMLITLM
jgi:hypothetical protein